LLLLESTGAVLVASMCDSTNQILAYKSSLIVEPLAVAVAQQSNSTCTRGFDTWMKDFLFV
jgi:hypothetical protein